MISSLQLKRISIVLILFALFVCFIWVNTGYGQTQRNPVLEFCTGVN